MHRGSHALPTGTSVDHTLFLFLSNTTIMATIRFSFSSSDPDEGLSLLVQVQDGLQGGRAQTVPQHQEEVSSSLSHRAVVFLYHVLIT